MRGGGIITASISCSKTQRPTRIGLIHTSQGKRGRLSASMLPFRLGVSQTTHQITASVKSARPALVKESYNASDAIAKSLGKYHCTTQDVISGFSCGSKCAQLAQSLDHCQGTQNSLHLKPSHLRREVGILSRHTSGHTWNRLVDSLPNFRHCIGPGCETRQKTQNPIHIIFAFISTLLPTVTI